MQFFDSHAHYNDEKFNSDRDEVLKKIHKEGVTKVIIAGYNYESSRKAIEIAKSMNNMYATCGISPNDIIDEKTTSINEIKALCLSNNKVVAVGEIGLDYYWNRENKILQKKYFEEQILLANELNMPIVIHSRDAYIDTIAILKKCPCKRKSVFHCCQLNLEQIKDALKLGYYISLAGACTFKNAKNADEIIKQVPIEKLLIETDSPYLAPEPVRGTRNDSSNLKYTAKKIAQIKQISIEDVAKITYQNTEKIFNI